MGSLLPISARFPFPKHTVDIACIRWKTRAVDVLLLYGKVTFQHDKLMILFLHLYADWTIATNKRSRSCPKSTAVAALNVKKTAFSFFYSFSALSLPLALWYSPPIIDALHDSVQCSIRCTLSFPIIIRMLYAHTSLFFAMFALNSIRMRFHPSAMA